MRVSNKDLPPGLRVVVKGLGGHVFIEEPNVWHSGYAARFEDCDERTLVYVEGRAERAAIASLNRKIASVAKAVCEAEGWEFDG